MDLIEKYKIIISKMNNIDYESIWQDFHKYNIALYNDNYVCYQGRLIPKTNDFLANTSIKYNNEMIGIWYLQEEIDDDILTSKLIHETFHAFQMESKESRYPNELEALIKYKYDLRNLSLKNLENKLIVELIDTFNRAKFDELMYIRKTRLALYPYEVEYEMKIEQIEGTANYVELESLKQLNYNKYQNKLNQMKNTILNCNNLFPVRIISYDVGALLIKVLVDNLLNINFHFTKNYYIDYFLDTDIPVVLNIKESVVLKIKLKEFISETRRLIKKSVTEENLIIKGNFKLLGVNVYNARYLDNFIITEYFLMYKENNEDKILNGDFVVKVDNDLIISDVYKLVR